MIEFVYGQDKEVALFVNARMPHSRGFGENIKTIGIVDEKGVPLAGVVYHDWDPKAGTIFASLAASSARWLTRPVLQRIADYPFNECGCHTVFAWTQADNTRLLRQLAIVGFSFVRIPRAFGRNADGVVAVLTDDDWKECRFNRTTKLEFVEKEAA